jgi:hypothetical protein
MILNAIAEKLKRRSKDDFWPEPCLDMTRRQMRGERVCDLGRAMDAELDVDDFERLGPQRGIENCQLSLRPSQTWGSQPSRKAELAL